MADKTPEEILAEEEQKAEEARIQAEKEAEEARKAALIRSPSEKDNDMVEKLVNEKLDGKLKDIKEKLELAYKARDKALAEKAELERKEREAQIKKLEEDGKHKEAYELKLAEKDAELNDLKKRNTELSRDVAVRDALKGFTFRSPKAAEMAFREVVSNLVQDANGLWVHRSGVSINDYVNMFAKDEEQQFLFKAKMNSGAGTSGAGTSGGTGTDNGEKRSVFKMSQAEVIKLAEEGKL